MHQVYCVTQKGLPRRTLLKGAGVAMGLPYLESMRPAFASGKTSDEVPRRLIAINIDLGFMSDNFFPSTTGPDYELSPYLQVIEAHRRHFSVFSGLSHPGVYGGHQSDVSFLTGAPYVTSPGFRNSISLDQFAAERIGTRTRFPTLNLRVGPGDNSLAFTADGVRLPSENSPSQVFRTLFVQGSPSEVENQIHRLREGRSLMDSISDRIRRLQGEVGPLDRARLDQYFTAVREFENRLMTNEEWERKPKPAVEATMPVDNTSPGALVERTQSMYDLARLAIATDSTRLITIVVTQTFNPQVDLPGVSLPHHTLSHQSQQPDTRKQLQTIEEAQMGRLGNLLGMLTSQVEEAETLLDRTMVLHGSNLGNASLHDNRNLPILLAGGGFRHGQHLAFDRQNNMPLCNLYLSMLHRLGIDCLAFSTSSGTLTGLVA